MTPTIRPARTRAETRLPRNATPIVAVNKGVAALSRAAKPAGSVRVAMAMNVNGSAENKAPTTTKLATRPRMTGSVRIPANASRTSAPITSRISAAQTGPTCGAAIRMNRKTAPQTAPRYRSEPRSTRERRRFAGILEASVRYPVIASVIGRHRLRHPAEAEALDMHPAR